MKTIIVASAILACSTFGAFAQGDKPSAPPGGVSAECAANPQKPECKDNAGSGASSSTSSQPAAPKVNPGTNNPAVPSPGK